ncbi:MAG: glutathione S-transferase [Hyphomicrobiaceae bacterium]|jgi:glutathione S-transferase
MKLYDSLGPNPRVVRMFLAEKGIEIALEQVDLMGGDNRRGPYLEKNPAGQLPALELDDGSVIGEITAICEYLDEVHPEPPLIGSTPQERAETRMWVRRCDLNIAEPMANGFRFAEGIDLFRDRLLVIPQAADDLKATAVRNLRWLDGLMAGRQWIAGDRFTLADICLYGIVDFAAGVGQPLDPALAAVTSWYERVGARPSATASLHEASAATGMRG